MGSDKIDFLRTKPAYPMYYDKNHNYNKDRDFWLKLILVMIFGNYAQKKYLAERDRARQTERLNGFKDIPAHHFHNRGGVVVLKEFTGFQKYYKNTEELMSWYKHVYPKQFGV